MPTLLYIGENPGHGTGTPVIVLRHLRRFADAGWRIVVVAEYGGNYALCRAAGWTVRALPHRRWWWPPFRPGSPLLPWLRLRLLARDIVADGLQPDAILSYLAAHAPFSAALAAQVAALTGAPLHTLVHDDVAAFPAARGRGLAQRRKQEAILRRATACWFASPELAGCFPSVAARARVLPPIPEGWDQPACWRDSFAAAPQLFYAGYVWPQQVPLLVRIAHATRRAGAELVVVARAPAELRAAAGRHPLTLHPPFGTNREALAHLAGHAAGLLVSYAESLAAMPWSATSFPSKLIEYTHLGLPIAIVAPDDTAVAHWAARTGFADLFAPENLGALQAWIAGLRQPELWHRRAAAARQLARTEFDPERIQAELANAVTPGTERRAA